jgi:hypothetical protein
LQNQSKQWLHETMSTDSRPSRDRVAATRARQAAAGLVNIQAVMPADLIAEMDRIKKERGDASRAPLIVEAVRFYIENTRA